VKTIIRLGACVTGFVIATAVVALLLASSAVASGGTSIASAPMLPLGGALETGGGKRGEFWRMQLYGGDRVTIDMELSGGEYQADLFLIAPSINDFTLQGSTPTLDLKARIGKSQNIMQAPSTGLWTLDICQQTVGSFCTNDGEYFGSAAEPYSFTATVTHATSLLVSAPTLARRASSATVRASVESPAGTPQGSCLIQGAVVPLAGGRCAKRVQLGHGHRQTIRVSFVPDDGWQAGSGRRTIRLLP
jgi:hypothetical protein